VMFVGPTNGLHVINLEWAARVNRRRSQPKAAPTRLYIRWAQAQQW
jgi:hypothetical protein